MERETLYVQRAGGHWEVWTYSDGDRVHVMDTRDYDRVEKYAKRHQYRLVHVR